MYSSTYLWWRRRKRQLDSSRRDTIRFITEIFFFCHGSSRIEQQNARVITGPVCRRRARSRATRLHFPPVTRMPIGAWASRETTARNVVETLLLLVTAGAEHEELPETLQRRRPSRSHEAQGPCTNRSSRIYPYLTDNLKRQSRIVVQNSRITAQSNIGVGRAGAQPFGHARVARRHVSKGRLLFCKILLLH